MNKTKTTKQPRSRRTYYEQPRKKISADIPYQLYTSLKDRSRDMKISMVKLITEAFEDVLKKTDKDYDPLEGLALSEVFKNDDCGDNENEDQLDFENISKEFVKEV
jgi:hypothetical protein